MLEGNLYKSILSFAFPLILAGVLQQLYNAADIAIVGQFAGREAVAAVGATTTTISLLVVVSTNIATGFNILLARAMGAKDDEKIKSAVGTAFLFSIGLSLAVMVAGILLSKPLLRLTDCPENIFKDATTYMRIYMLGVPASMFYNFMSSVLRISGDSRRPFIYLATSGIANVVLNVVFVLAFGLPVVGVAVATVVAQYLSAGMLFIRLVRLEDATRLDLRNIKFDLDSLGKIVRYGIPSAISNATFSASNMMIQSAINAFGDVGISANTASASIESFVFTITGTFVVAVSAFVGQNLGAGNRKRVSDIMRVSYAICAAMTLVISALGIIFGKGLLSLYLPNDTAAVDFGYVRLCYIMGAMIFNALSSVTVGAMQAFGYTTVQMLSNIIGVCGFRFVWMLAFYPLDPTPEMLYVCYPVSWGLTLAFNFIFTLVILRRYKKGADFRL